MKLTNFKMTAAGMILLALAMNACKKAAPVDEPATGNPVEFALATPDDDAATRTEFTGIRVDGHELVFWSENDQISIIADQVGDKDPFNNYSSANYIISNVRTQGRYSTGDLSPVSDPLYWGGGMHNFYAVYPSGLEIAYGDDSDAMSVVSDYTKNPVGWRAQIPASQTFTFYQIKDYHSLIGIPDMSYNYMVALQGNRNPNEIIPLYFKPFVKVFEFSIKNDTGENLTLNKAVLSSTSSPLSGTMIALWGSDGPTLAATDEITEDKFRVVPSPLDGATEKTVTVLLGDKTLEKGGYCCFDIFAIPSGSDYNPTTDLTLEIHTPDHVLTKELNDKSSGSPLTFSRYGKSVITGLNMTDFSSSSNTGGGQGSAPVHSFVLPDGGYIRFASSNLEYNKGSWSFSKDPWDVYDRQSAYWEGYSYSSGELGTFGWSSQNGDQWGIDKSKYLGSNDDNTYGHTYSDTDFVDWGQNIKDGHNWRTLTKEEWIYVAGLTADIYDNQGNLLTYKWTTSDYENSGYWRPNADLLRGHATLSEHNLMGLILLPDDWVCPDGITFSPGSQNTTLAEANTYTDYEWSQMQDAGAVFLPCLPNTDSYSGEKTGYWSATVVDYDITKESTYEDNPTAFAMFFHCWYKNSVDASMKRTHRNGGEYGWAVRLAEDVTE